MRRLVVTLATATQGALMGLGLLAFVTLHPATTDYIAQKALRDNGVAYGRIEGTLLSGFDLYDVRWQKAFYARHVALRYNLLRLLSPRPVMGEVLVEEADLHPLRIRLPKSETNATSTPIHLPPIEIESVVVKAFRIHVPETIVADLSAKDLLYFDGAVTVPRLEAKADSPWAHASLRGRYEKGVLKAGGRAMVSRRYRRLAQKYLKGLPSDVPVRLRLDPARLDAHATLPDSVTLREGNVTLENAEIDFRYLFGPNYMEADASYRLRSPFAEGKVRQHAILTPSLAYATTVEGEISRSSWTLPAKRIEIDAAGDRDAITADARFGPFRLSLYSTDYERFALHAAGAPHRLDYLVHLPKIFSSQTVSMESNATLTLAPDAALKGTLTLDGNFSRTRSFVEWRGGKLLVKALVEPRDVAGGIWKSLPPLFKHDIHLYLFHSKENKLLNVSTRDAYLTLFERDRRVRGWANIGSLTLDAKGELAPDDTLALDFHTKVDSLYALLQELGVHTDVTVDAEIESRFRVLLGEKLSLFYRTTIPWYLVQPDSQTVYYGLDSSLEGGIAGESITIDRYDVGFMQRRFSQTRRSRFHFDDELNFHIDELAVLDTGTLKGFYSLENAEGAVRFDAKKAHYRGPEGNLTFNAAVDANLSSKALVVEGEVELLEGKVVYMPKKEYTVSDEDIVIIQDIREPSHTRKSLNIHIFSKKPIRYEIPMVRLDFVPDITIWKEPLKPVGILGIVRIKGGAIDVEEKHFVVKPSEIYFAGAYPPNPYLDIHIGYELDFNRFNIYVSHTLSDPVFLFSSEPPMSQNDIMSYILFGTPAGETFQGGRGGSSDVAAMLLGLGIKNAIGAATGLKFDTFNILNTEEGGFGIEIGKRIGKRFRIIYRNDTLSSFILQYTLSKNVRVDVDVRETGQGVNVLYIRDMHGPKFLERRR